ncbi:hypothetical protein [Streptomyces sp. Wb2n-11]|uniref:hypothetical protein n=1 Tax=Streptomyces sp. Wb2n-11 TaxID=1030533 RepID=UPI000A4B5A12|nr:hypothetical protein [Streptomyces sp. Wb2n-11]
MRGLPPRMLFPCRKTDGLSAAPLAGLPALRTPGLGFARETAGVGVIPAGAGPENLTVRPCPGTTVRGAALFPPERLVRHH